MLMLLREDEQQLVVDALNTVQLKNTKKYKALRKRIEKYMAEAKADSDRNNKFVEGAQAKSREGELEVDDSAVVSEGDDDGAYVQAWLWVTTKQAGLPSKEDDNDENEEKD